MNKIAQCVHGLARVVDGESEPFHRAGSVVAFVEDEWNEAIVLQRDVIDRKRVARGLTNERRVNGANPRSARDHRYGFAGDFVGERGAARRIAQRVRRLNQFADAFTRAETQDDAVLDNDEGERIGIEFAPRDLEVSHSKSVARARRCVKRDTAIRSASCVSRV